jgi:outer membrane protein assembly factor BamD (BamD/ComL family)
VKNLVFTQKDKLFFARYSTIIYQIFEMKKIVFFIFCISILAACKDAKREKAIEEIKSREKVLIANLKDINKASVDTLIQKYDAFVAAYPKDTMSAQMIFKAADLSRGVGEFGKAINYWGMLGEAFPNYSKTADAAYLQAFTFENDLGDKDNAKRYYQKFLEKYPKHALANDAQKAIEQIDIPAEQLVKQFEKMNEAELAKAKK